MQCHVLRDIPGRSNLRANALAVPSGMHLAIPKPVQEAPPLPTRNVTEYVTLGACGSGYLSRNA
jgi:hypothetical protein